MSDIMLGEGVFSVGTATSTLTAVALTRGGGNITIEREYREVEADGDYGPVRGRIDITRSVPKMTLNVLEKIEANMVNFYPGMASSGTTKITGTLTVADGDYKAARFTGKTRGGKDVKITILNAINLENLDWDLVDKEDVVPEVTYTGSYGSTTRNEEPWEVEWST